MHTCMHTAHAHTHTHTHTRNAMSAATDLKGRGAAGSIFGSFSLASSFCLPPKLSHPLQQCTAQPGMTAGQCADREVHSCGRMDWRKHGKCSRDVCEEQEHVCVYTHTHTHTHTPCMRTCTQTHMHTHTCAHTHTPTATTCEQQNERTWLPTGELTSVCEPLPLPLQTGSAACFPEQRRLQSAVLKLA